MSSQRKSGAASKKMSKYPRILDFLQAHHPDLYSIIDDLALAGSLTPKRGAEGITFLLPDASFIKELRKQTDGSDPEVATDMIFSLIVPLHLHSAKAWTSVQDDVPNLLGKKIEVKNVGASEITLPKGKIVLNKKFKPFARSGNSARGNMNVWDLTGTIDYSKTAPESSRKYTKKGGAASKRNGRKGGKRGGFNDDGFDQVDSRIRKFVRDVEEMELIAMGDKKPGDACNSVKLRVLANYHKIVKSRADKGDDEAKNHLDYFHNMCELSFSGGVEAAFYLTFCCRDSEDRHGLSNSLFLSEFTGDRSPLLAAVNKPLDYLNKALSGKRGGMDEPTTFDVEVVIDNLSWGVRASSSKDIVNAYNDYGSKMNDCPSKHRFTSVPNLKLLIDEFKFHCVHAFKNTIRMGREASGADCRRNYADFLRSLDSFRSVGGDVIINNPTNQSKILVWSGDSMVDSDRIRYMKDFLTEPDGMCRDSRRRVNGGDESDDTARYHPCSNDYANPGMDDISASAKTEINNYRDSHDGAMPKF